MKLALLITGVILTFSQNAFALNTNCHKSHFEEVSVKQNSRKVQLNKPKKSLPKKSDDKPKKSPPKKSDDDPIVPTY